jgi:hypothetical protein
VFLSNCMCRKEKQKSETSDAVSAMIWQLASFDGICIPYRSIHKEFKNDKVERVRKSPYIFQCRTRAIHKTISRPMYHHRRPLLVFNYNQMDVAHYDMPTLCLKKFSNLTSLNGKHVLPTRFTYP